MFVSISGELGCSAHLPSVQAHSLCSLAATPKYTPVFDYQSNFNALNKNSYGINILKFNHMVQKIFLLYCIKGNVMNMWEELPINKEKCKLRDK